MQKILIVDDEKSVRYSFRKLLSTGKYELFEAGNFDEALKVFDQVCPDLAIVDIEMPGKSGLDLLKEFGTLRPLMPVIVMTAYGSGDRVIMAMKHGAYEYIEKPFEIPQLIRLIEEALASVSSASKEDMVWGDKGKAKSATAAREGQEVIIGESPAIKDVYKLIGRVASCDASILVTGESGTGKEMVARAIHRYSDRAHKPFIALNCAAIPETLLESELFGYDKGAFTGATKDKPGKFEEAHQGTLFLDEIGDMGLSLQSKLLRVLQEGIIDRLGSSKSIRVDVRIVTATNRNLETLIARKAFREDLYYRIRVVTIALPPLRMRKEDIPLLVQHFLAKHLPGKKTNNISILPQTMQKLQEYSWPGNIRELENTIKRALILAKGNIISPDLIAPDTAPQPSDIQQSPLEFYLQENWQEGKIYDRAFQAFEKELIQ
ncbi:MAG: sigma-54-dependent transcriptional regulator [Bacteroidales bacterium]